MVRFQILVILLTLLLGCQEAWNDPYPQFQEMDKNLYMAFSQRPKRLDPATSYSAEEALLIQQIYEPPLQYRYAKNAYELVPLSAQALPQIKYLNQQGEETEQNARIAKSIYQITIRPGIYYQPHPAFAKVGDHYLYHALSANEVKDKYTLQDFPHHATRELIAEDFVYQIKRLADPHINSPIFGLMENYIVGFKEFSQKLQDVRLDLRAVSLTGVKALDRYTYQIEINGKYPQFLYWLAMPFFAPLPWEADKFYQQSLLEKKNISLNWYPVGTGPFLLNENNPNLRMILLKNPHYHALPASIERVVFVLENENIPYWNKFLQGYYDQAIITQDFDQALSLGGNRLKLSPDLQTKGVQLNEDIAPSIFYWGVNMLDQTLGGHSEKARKLRQAIKHAFDIEEYIAIFLNGNGVVAHSPIPPSVAQFEKRAQQTLSKKNALIQAKKLMGEAGFINGIDPKTHQPLTLFLDIPATGADSQAQLAWMRKQFAKLGIDLVIRATQYNRFQDKIAHGDFQLYFLGWNADYPDPENFLFLFYSKNGKVKFHGENVSNYANSEFDSLFEQMVLDYSRKTELIEQMVRILQEDCPWLAAFHPKIYSLQHQWVKGFRHPMARNTIKYMTIDPLVRSQLIKQWNQPMVWPLLLVMALFMVLIIPAILTWRKNCKRSPLMPPQVLRK